MKVRIRQKFIDRISKRLYKPGEIVDLTAKRAEEIGRKLPDAIEIVEDTEKSAQKAEKPKRARARKKAVKTAEKSE